MTSPLDVRTRPDVSIPPVLPETCAMSIKLDVNGQPHAFDGDPQMPLLWAIRDHLQLTGTKFGCGMALCGACTVHLDGRAIRSCVTPVSAAAAAF